MQHEDDRASVAKHGGTNLLLELKPLGTDVFEPSCGLMEFKAFDVRHLPHGRAAYNRCHYSAAARVAFGARFQKHPMRKAVDV